MRIVALLAVLLAAPAAWAIGPQNSGNTQSAPQSDNATVRNRMDAARDSQWQRQLQEQETARRSIQKQ